MNHDFNLPFGVTARDVEGGSSLGRIAKLTAHVQVHKGIVVVEKVECPTCHGMGTTAGIRGRFTCLTCQGEGEV